MRSEFSYRRPHISDESQKWLSDVAARVGLSDDIDSQIDSAISSGPENQHNRSAPNQALVQIEHNLNAFNAKRATQAITELESQMISERDATETKYLSGSNAVAALDVDGDLDPPRRSRSSDLDDDFESDGQATKCGSINIAHSVRTDLTGVGLQASMLRSV